MDLLVTTVLPLALSPVIVEVLHLVAAVAGGGISQGVLETALAALAQAEEHEGQDGEHNGRRGANVDSNVSALAEIIPLLRQRLGLGFVELVQSSGVAATAR